MPCYRCGARQVDPVRGHSPWRRGVKSDQQVLVCPGCQAAGDWTADLDKCRRCGSVHLVRRLGEVECRDCGATIPPATEVGEPVAAGRPPEPSGTDRAPGPSGTDRASRPSGTDRAPGPSGADRAPGLSEEVARALERVLGRGAAG